MEAPAPTFDDLLEGYQPSVRAVAHRLRSLVLSLDPECVEVPRPGDRAASYGVGPRKMIEGYAYLMPQRGWVNLGFFHGAVLPDPEGLLEGTGKAMRHVKVACLDDADRPAIWNLVVAARRERLEALGRSDREEG